MSSGNLPKTKVGLQQALKVMTFLSWAGPLVFLIVAFAIYKFSDFDMKNIIVIVLLFAAGMDAVVFKLLGKNIQSRLDQM